MVIVLYCPWLAACHVPQALTTIKLGRKVFQREKNNLGSATSLSLSVSPSLRLSVSPSLRLSVSPSLRLSVPPSLRPSVHPSLRRSVPPSLFLSLFLSLPVSLSVCLCDVISVSYETSLVCEAYLWRTPEESREIQYGSDH